LEKWWALPKYEEKLEKTEGINRAWKAKRRIERGARWSFENTSKKSVFGFGVTGKYNRKLAV